MQQSPRYHFNRQDLTKALWVLAHALIGALATTAIELAGNFDFGPYRPTVMVLLSFISAGVKQYLSGPSCASQTSSLSVTTTQPAPPVTEIVEPPAGSEAGTTTTTAA